jgi:hypothetical protein
MEVTPEQVHDIPSLASVVCSLCFFLVVCQGLA